jgi:hypothetical protein
VRVHVPGRAAPDWGRGGQGVRGACDWAAKLLSWKECEPLLDEFCAEAGLPATAEEFVDSVRTQLAAKAAEVDAGYPESADLVIDEETGRPSLRRRKGKDRSQSAIVLEEQVKERMPERTVLEMLARTAYWIGWHLRFGPASGSDRKLANPLLRYVLTTFTYGSRMGPAQAARHMRGVSAHELGATFIRHSTTEKLDCGIADVINSYLGLDIAKVWGEARSVAADGTQVDTLLDNLLAERHIRYGGYGGIAYHHVADNYIALFSHFIPCGVWEAVYIIEGLLKQRSEVDPDTIHADTHGQSYPVHALAHLFGFELLTRIRNWKDRIFYRPDREIIYRHIDSLFGAQLTQGLEPYPASPTWTPAAPATPVTSAHDTGLPVGWVALATLAATAVIALTAWQRRRNNSAARRRRRQAVT